MIVSLEIVVETISNQTYVEFYVISLELLRETILLSKRERKQ